MKRIIALMLALLTCATMFVACGTDPVGPVDDTTPAVEDTTTEAPAETTAPAVPVVVAADGATEYIVIRPDGAGQAVVTAASDLRVALSDAAGVQFRISDDWVKDPTTIPENAKEIVVGQCNRPENANIEKTLRRLDFAIVYAGERIYITGGSDEAVARGVEYFIANFIDTASKSVNVMSDLSYFEAYQYPLGTISINGVNLMDYTIVTPKNCDVLTAAAAENLVDYLYYTGGIVMETVSDSEAVTDYEILIGNTNRPESAQAAAVSLTDDQFVLAGTGSKIVMYGKGYMVGGAVSEFINAYMKEDGKAADITTIPTTYSAKTFEFKTPTSALLLIGDGMGFNHVEATLAANKLKEFVARQLPNQGSVITESYSVQTGKAGFTDSAAAATALATGFKTMNGYVGVDHKGRTVQNVRELAHSKGAKTAVITTDVITGATPGGFLAHASSRNSTAELQKQIDQLVSSGKINYAISHKDSDNVIDAIHEPLWGIAQGDGGYFAMIEAAYIDKRSHSVDMNGMMARVVRYNEFIAYCIEFTLCNPDSVLIITADHETGGITKKADGTFEYTSYDKPNHVEHTNADVPVYAMGVGTEMFNGTKVDNTQIPKFIAKIFGATTFGQ